MTAGATPGIRAITWWLWPWMSWLLPALFCLRGALDGGALLGTLLLFGAVLIIPAAGVLGMLPRRVLLDRGIESMPGPAAGLLILHWWGWVTTTIAIPDFAFDGQPRSFLRGVMHLQVSDEAERAVFIVSAVVVVLTWAAVLAVCIGAPSDARRRRWGALAWVVAFAAPVLVVVAIGGAVSATQAEHDAAGETRSIATSRPIGTQRELVHERYAQEQAALSTARAVIVPGVWAATGTMVSDGACDAPAGGCYRLTIGYIFTPDAPITMHGVRAALVAEGWEPVTAEDQGLGDRIVAVDGSGRTLTFAEYSNGSYSLALESASWWISPELFREIDTGQAPAAVVDGGRLYAPDEWPELALG